MAKSDYLEKAVLDHFLAVASTTAPVGVFLALYSTDPTDADAGTELAGFGYARQSITFNPATSGAGNTTNSNTVTFTASGGNWANATHFGVRDALTGGNLLYHAPLDNPRQINDGEQLIFDPGSVQGSES